MQASGTLHKHTVFTLQCASVSLYVLSHTAHDKVHPCRYLRINAIAHTDNSTTNGTLQKVQFQKQETSSRRSWTFKWLNLLSSLSNLPSAVARAVEQAMITECHAVPHCSAPHDSVEDVTACEVQLSIGTLWPRIYLCVSKSAARVQKRKVV
jgi:hypothetical protein